MLQEEYCFFQKGRQIVLFDEISGGNMRAYKNGLRVELLELERIMLNG